MSSGAPIAELAWQEVVELHAFFEAWLRGEASALDFSRAETSIAADFRMIAPSGRVEDREAVVAWIKGARGTAPSDFKIVALDPSAIWTREGAVLLEYTEQQYRDGKTTRRRSTALFLAAPSAPCGVEWRHLQETWMDVG